MKIHKSLEELGKKLTEDTKGMKHNFREIWIHQMIDFYNKTEGINRIHLKNLDSSIFLSFDEKGNDIIRNCINIETLTKNKSYYAILRYLKGKTRHISLRNLRKFSERDLNKLEMHVSEIKTTKSGAGKVTKNPKFPINLDSEFGALLLGIFPDTAISTGEIVSNDLESLRKLEKSYNSHVGDTKALIYGKNAYRMQLSPLIKILFKLSGLKTDKKQIISNNALPKWVFNSSIGFQKLLLRSLWDAEGSAPVNKKMCFGQSVVLRNIREDVDFYPKKKRYADCKNKDDIKNSPPNLLVSIQLLLFDLGIISYIKPHRLYKKKNGMLVCDWHLIITRYPNIKKFHDAIGFGLNKKEKKLKSCLESYTRNFPKDKIERDLEIISLVMSKEPFTIMDIVGKVNLSEGTIRNYLTRLVKKDKIERIGTVKQPSGPSFYNKYRVIKYD